MGRDWPTEYGVREVCGVVVGRVLLGVTPVAALVIVMRVRLKEMIGCIRGQGRPFQGCRILVVIVVFEGE